MLQPSLDIALQNNLKKTIKSIKKSKLKILKFLYHIIAIPHFLLGI